METNERTTALEINFTNMQKQLDSIEGKIDLFIKKIEDNYVTKEQFAIVKNIVYGMISVILLSVIGGLMSLLLK